MSEIMKICIYHSIAEAELARKLLKEYDIEGIVQKRGIQFPGDMGDAYGADLFVVQENVERVKRVLGIDSL